MTKEELTKIARDAADDMTGLIAEESDRILKDMAEGAKEAALHDSKFRFGLRFALVISDEKINNRLAWSQGHKRDCDRTRDDLRQGELPMGTEGAEAAPEAPPEEEKPKRRKRKAKA